MIKIKSKKSVFDKIVIINRKTEKKVFKLLQSSGGGKLLLPLVDEWKSTPNLSSIIETNGKGDFRSVATGRLLKFNSRSTKNMNKARVKVFRDKDDNKIVVSLQKFVALIYHPRINGSTSTKVLDGDRDNLSKDNVAWSRVGNYKY